MDEGKDKRRGIYMLIFVLLIIGGTIGIHITYTLFENVNSVAYEKFIIFQWISGLDVLAWLRIAAKKKDEEACMYIVYIAYIIKM